MWVLCRTLPHMSIYVRIYDTDTLDDIASKIFNDFDVMAFCTIFGFLTVGEKLVPKGEIVLRKIKEMDIAKNVPGGKRKNVYKKDSIGGCIAQKIFTWEKRIVDKDVRYTIWRYQ